MTRMEVYKILAYVQVAFPNTKYQSSAEEEIATQLWNDQIGEFSYDVVYAAVRSTIAAGRQFAPTAGEVRQMVIRITNPDLKGEDEIFNEIKEAGRNAEYPWDAKESFDGMGEIARRVVGSPRNLSEYCLADGDTRSVIESGFRRDIRTAMERAQFERSIPSDVREGIRRLAEKMDMEKKALAEEEKERRQLEAPKRKEQAEKMQKVVEGLEKMFAVPEAPKEEIPPTDPEEVEKRRAAIYDILNRREEQRRKERNDGDIDQHG